MRRARLLANDPESAGNRQSIHNPPLCQVMHRMDHRDVYRDHDRCSIDGS